MTVLQRNSLLILLILGFLSGCDDFSLTDEFILDPIDTGGSGSSSELIFSVAQTTLLRYEWIQHFTSGGTEPYAYSNQGIDLAYTDGVGTINETGYSAGNSIGLMRLTVSDAEGATAFADVTILPEKPENFEAEKTEETEVTVSWDENIDGIDGFKLYRRIADDESFTLIQILGASSQPYTDDGLSAEKVYYYYLTSYAGDYESEGTSVVQVDMNS